MSTTKTSVPVPRRGDNAIERCHELCGIAGHPLQILSAENAAIERLVRRIQDRIAAEDPNNDPGSVIPELESLRKISAHYAKKGDLIYPGRRHSRFLSGSLILLASRLLNLLQKFGYSLVTRFFLLGFCSSDKSSQK